MIEFLVSVGKGTKNSLKVILFDSFFRHYHSFFCTFAPDFN